MWGGKAHGRLESLDGFIYRMSFNLERPER